MCVFMNLCIDIGNTRVKLAFFSEEGLLQKVYVWDKMKWKKLEAKIEEYRVERAIISSVRRKNKKWLHRLAQWVNVVVLKAKTPLPIGNAYHSPKTLGRDRLAAVVGAHHLYPDEDILVIDAGTCITYDYLSAAGVYEGGSISAGLNLRYRALYDFTARLPLLQKEPLKGLTGKDTVSSIQTGVQQGLVFEMEGFIQAYSAQCPTLRVVLTGGDAAYFESQLKSQIFAHPYLVLIGLNKILNYNVQELV